jgi:hypothetical protein
MDKDGPSVIRRNAILAFPDRGKRLENILMHQNISAHFMIIMFKVM